ncbi:hypothetical protein J2T17_006398 [Paenibacillus mucilaginosus]|uniref:hypothetical protein n=1 Tax=Paenibacillus mucilaginosus TaxID=61624 RepID=UPI003D2530FE
MKKRNLELASTEALKESLEKLNSIIANLQSLRRNEFGKSDLPTLVRLRERIGSILLQRTKQDAEAPVV